MSDLADAIIIRMGSRSWEFPVPTEASLVWHAEETGTFTVSLRVFGAEMPIDCFSVPLMYEGDPAFEMPTIPTHNINQGDRLTIPPFSLESGFGGNPT